ncbi:Protein of unknown function DUF295 [Macleaya cordata]|uniref:KIB1-4 beta-propeller domain-containing protein n=1 Tax=Macleaya cordata TaxID=56857 RepID=A0A200QKC4_MACCD|nr:Protein of unknown function DUF295 [Macleaya cordata]
MAGETERCRSEWAEFRTPLHGQISDEYLLQHPSNGKQYTHDLNRIRDFFIKKVALSSSSTSLDKDYIAVAVVDQTWELTFCKKGDEAWTVIKDALGYCEDVIHYKNLFYAVNREGSLAICDVISDLSPLVTVLAPPLPVVSHVTELVVIPYLVDSFWVLLLVKRYLELVDGLEFESLGFKTVGFDISRLDSSIPKWVEVKSLGDHMLFLGTNSSLCLLATEFSGCEGNCIYFTVSYNAGHYVGSWNYDTGVFNVGDGSIKPLANCTGYFGLSFTPPVWVTPNPC